MPADGPILRVTAVRGATRGTATAGDRAYPCAVGRGGLSPDKREGDGATPTGTFRLLRCYYRADRGHRPVTALETIAIAPDLGWCDDPADPERYNRPVSLPYDGSHERMWREDSLYDIVVEIDHNSDPPAPGLGSAVFLHLARDDWGPTEGCVAFRREDLCEILASREAGDRIAIALA